MVYLINCVVMRKFAFVHSEFFADDYRPVPVDGCPVYQPSVYDSVMLEEVKPDAYMMMDMTSILLHQEKYRRLLGDANMQRIIDEMHPTPSTVQDGMTDEQRFDAVISRHCQSLSERQAVLSELSARSSEMKAFIESMNAKSAEQDPAAGSAVAS